MSYCCSSGVGRQLAEHGRSYFGFDDEGGEFGSVLCVLN